MKAAASAALRAFADKKSEIVKYLLAFAAVMLIGAGLISFQGEDPVRALSAIWSGALGGRIEIGNTIRWIIPCVMTGMAAVVAFKSGVNNLGIEGQIYFGGFAAAMAGFLVQLPPVVHVLFCLLVGGLCGLLYALIPAVLKLFFRIDEMITTLMLNYIAILLTEYFTVLVIGASSSTASNALQTPPVYETAKLPVLIKGTYANAGIFVAVAVVIVVAFIYRYTIKGYELRQVGENLRFSKVGGVNVVRTFLSIFLISGFVAGLCGGVEVLGSHGRFVSRFSNNLGWDGIMISMIAKNSPFGVLFVSILWGVLKAGALHMERVTNTNRLTVVLIQALFVLFRHDRLQEDLRLFPRALRAPRRTEGGAPSDASGHVQHRDARRHVPAGHPPHPRCGGRLLRGPRGGLQHRARELHAQRRLLRDARQLPHPQPLRGGARRDPDGARLLGGVRVLRLPPRLQRTCREHRAQ